MKIICCVQYFVKIVLKIALMLFFLLDSCPHSLYKASKLIGFLPLRQVCNI